MTRFALSVLLLVPFCEAVGREPGQACYDKLFSSSLQPWHDSLGNPCAYFEVDPGARCTNSAVTRKQYTSDEACCACNKPDSGTRPYYPGFPMHMCVNDGQHADFEGAVTHATLEECCRSLQPAFYAKCAGKEAEDTVYPGYPDGRCLQGVPSAPVLYPFCAVSSTGRITYVTSRFGNKASLPIPDASRCCDSVYAGLPLAAARCAARKGHFWHYVSGVGCVADGDLDDDPVLNSVPKHLSPNDAAGWSACVGTYFRRSEPHLCSTYTCPAPNYIGKPGKDAIHCGASAADCTLEICCEITCANPAVAVPCDHQYTAKANQDRQPCKGGQEACSANFLSECCETTCGIFEADGGSCLPNHGFRLTHPATVCGTLPCRDECCELVNCLGFDCGADASDDKPCRGAQCTHDFCCSPICYPLSSRVALAEGRTVAAGDVTSDDLLVICRGTVCEPQQMSGWIHLERRAAVFVALEHEHGKVVLSGSHYLCHERGVLMARDCVVGDQICAFVNGTVVMSRIVRIGEETHVGYGSLVAGFGAMLVVDGVLVTEIATISPWAWTIGSRPVHVLMSLFGDVDVRWKERASEQHLHWWVEGVVCLLGLVDTPFMIPAGGCDHKTTLLVAALGTAYATLYASAGAVVVTFALRGQKGRRAAVLAALVVWIASAPEFQLYAPPTGSFLSQAPAIF